MYQIKKNQVSLRMTLDVQMIRTSLAAARRSYSSSGLGTSAFAVLSMDAGERRHARGLVAQQVVNMPEIE